MQSDLTSLGRFPTANASKYMQQLCKHFAHKVEVRYDDKTAEAAMPMGPCRMWANDTELRIEVTASTPEMLVPARKVIDSHLERFAFREEFKAMNWA